MKRKETDLCVLTRITDGSDPDFDERITIIDTLEGLKRKFDLSRGVPFGWELLQGKAAQQFIEKIEYNEARYQQARKNKK